MENKDLQQISAEDQGNPFAAIDWRNAEIPFGDFAELVLRQLVPPEAAQDLSFLYRSMYQDLTGMLEFGLSQYVRRENIHTHRVIYAGQDTLLIVLRQGRRNLGEAMRLIAESRLRAKNFMAVTYTGSYFQIFNVTTEFRRWFAKNDVEDYIFDSSEILNTCDPTEFPNNFDLDNVVEAEIGEVTVHDFLRQ
ncbi:MAG: hypothetical protein Q4D87_01580 [Actinomycetaceae bacterium]|nr:hypothetical protein [Actinomycetaceae bacterium]